VIILDSVSINAQNHHAVTDAIKSTAQAVANTQAVSIMLPALKLHATDSAARLFLALRLSEILVLRLIDVLLVPFHHLVAKIVHKPIQQPVVNSHSVRISSLALKPNALEQDAQQFLAHHHQLAKMLVFAFLAVLIRPVVKTALNLIAMSAVTTLPASLAMCAPRPFATIKDARPTSAQLVKTLAGALMDAK
jgi:hypothetical protein